MVVHAVVDIITVTLIIIIITFTAWKMSKYGVISGPYFSVFSQNTGKLGPEITPHLDTFHAMIILIIIVIPVVVVIIIIIIINHSSLLLLLLLLHRFQVHILFIKYSVSYPTRNAQFIRLLCFSCLAGAWPYWLNCLPNILTFWLNGLPSQSISCPIH